MGLTTPNGSGRLNKRALFEDLGYCPHSGQLEVHMSDAPRRILSCGARWGKTLCAGMEGLAAALQPCDRSVGWVVAPTYDLADRVFREIQLKVVQHLNHRVVVMRESERRLVVLNMAGGLSEIRAKSADNAVSLLGEGLDWVVVDEAARLKPTIWQSYISPRLIDRKGWALLISTPRGKGYFFDLFRRGQRGDPDYQSWNYPSRTNPILDASVIEAERARLPERVFRQEFEAQFLEGAGQVFRNVRERATCDWSPPLQGQRYFAGLDLAKVEDFTVLCVLSSKREVVFVDRFNRLDWRIQLRRIHAAAQRYNRARIYVDSTGVGEPIYEALRHQGCYVKPYAFTQRSKAALVDNLAMMLEQDLITLPRPEIWPEGIEELEGFQYSVTDSGNVKSAAPGGMHDDCVTALGLAAINVGPRKPGRVVELV